MNNQAVPNSSLAGDWRGQTQFQGAQNGVEIEEAHTVVPLVWTFSADGKVSAASAPYPLGESIGNSRRRSDRATIPASY